MLARPRRIAEPTTRPTANNLPFKTRRAEALEFMRGIVATARRPAILSSFGKESLALIGLAREAGLRVDIAYFELGAFPEKHLFARRIADDLKLSVELIEPHRTSVVRGEKDTSLAYEFDLTSGQTIRILGATFEEPRQQNVPCGLELPLARFGRHAPYPWDALFSGRRNSDVDITVGPLMWPTETEQLGSEIVIAMPLLHWSDQDLFQYLLAQRILPDFSRYEIAGRALRSRADKTANPDHASCCIRCLIAPRGTAIACPKYKRDIVSIAGIPATTTFVPNRVSPAIMF